jgi:glycosyltransferase involved in cell wall biosynthesis
VLPVYGVDVERFKPAHEPRAFERRKLGLPETGSLIFFSSRVAPEKDADTVLRALRELNETGRETWLLNRSGGFETFLARAEDFGVRGRVIAAGPVDPRRELAAFYRAVDVCVQASREEGLGFSPLEALASGTPVVATEVGGLRETIIDGETGWTYPRGDARRLAEAVEDVLQRPDEAARRTGRGRQMVLERFDQARVFANFQRLMEDLVSSRGTVRQQRAARDR